jgi:hypothetical protein
MVLYIRIFIFVSRQIDFLTYLHLSELCGQNAEFFVFNLAVQI